MGYRAMIQPQFSSRTVRILMMEDFPTAGKMRTLFEDGTWREVEEEQPFVTSGNPGESEGITLPVGAIDALLSAIEEWQGHKNHGDTEARVLREWLAVERARVDATLGK